MKALVVILDTLRRDYLEPYGASWVRTPSIARLAERSVVCDNHWVGSLPCMPARRELMTGRHNFLERGWGPLEPFDDVLPEQLRRREGKRPVFSHLITDHYHYFYLGGEGHNNSFSTWQFERGQEGDVWISRVDLPALPEAIGRLKARPQNALNRLAQREEHEFSGPRCVEHCRRWLDDNGAADDWLVQLELFDPHEPFYVVQQYLDLYGDRRRATRSTPPRRAVPSCRPRRRARATTPATSSTTWPPTLARRGAPGRRARGTLPRPLARPARPGRRARGASGPPRPVTARPWCAAARLARMTSRHARAGRSERDPPWHSPPSICARSPPIGARLYHWPCELAYTNDTIDALAEREMIERVLVVDDEELVRSFVTAVLDGEAKEIREAENGQQALDILAEWQPDVIVLDVAMPVMDGMAFLDAWSRSPDWRRIPVVVASGNVPRGPMYSALVELGVSDIVKKPFTMGTLLEAVRKAAASATT